MSQIARAAALRRCVTPNGLVRAGRLLFSRRYDTDRWDPRRADHHSWVDVARAVVDTAHRSDLERVPDVQTLPPADDPLPALTVEAAGNALAKYLSEAGDDVDPHVAARECLLAAARMARVDPDVNVTPALPALGVSALDGPQAQGELARICGVLAEHDVLIVDGTVASLPALVERLICRAADGDAQAADADRRLAEARRVLGPAG